MLSLKLLCLIIQNLNFILQNFTYNITTILLAGVNVTTILLAGVNITTILLAGVNITTILLAGVNITTILLAGVNVTTTVDSLLTDTPNKGHCIKSLSTMDNT